MNGPGPAGPGEGWGMIAVDLRLMGVRSVRGQG
jgi:hypothetical protein